MDSVVVDYRTPWDLAAFLRSYQAYPPADGNLWVVLVSPEPGTVVDVVGGWPDLDFETIICEDNVGYARACNKAAKRGSGEVIAFFNADVVLTSGALDACAEALAAEPTWGILGPRQVDEQNRFTAAGTFGPDYRPEHRAWMAPDAGQCSDVRTDAVTVSGAALFIKRKLWDELTDCPFYASAACAPEGAFLPTKHFYEETFCCYHARFHGALCVYYGPVKIVHKWAQATLADPGATMTESREVFRDACDLHSIPHE